MRIKNKILSGILALSAVACVSLGIAFQSDNNVTASAVSGLSVNTLGYLEWTAVDGATSYEVSSAYGTLTTTDTKVNVGDAIMKAAKSATAQNPDAQSASVAFTVTPVGAGEASEYLYNFNSYIDYSFDTRDVSQAQINQDGTLLGDDTIVTKKNAYRGAIKATYKNTLLTCGLIPGEQFGSKSTSHFFLFGRNDKVKADDGTYMTTSGTAYGAWRITNNKSNVKVFIDGSRNKVEDSTYTEVATFSTAAITEKSLYCYTMGVFDTYDLKGDKTGETFYLRRDKMDVNNQTKTKHNENSVFVNNETLTANNVTEDTYKNATCLGWKVPKVDELTYTIQSGKVNENENSPLYEATGLSLSTNGDIGVNLYVKNVSNVTGAFKAELTFNGETEVVDFVETQTAGVYKVSKAVAPKYIDEKITARVFVEGGPIGKAVQYSVRDYINQAEEGDKEYAITQALASYCDSVDTFFNAETEQPELDTTAVDLSNYAPTLVSADENVVPYGISLIVEDKTTIRFFFKVKGEMPEVFKADGKDVEVVADQMEGFYYIDLVDIDAKDLDKDFEFQVGNCKVQCSALTYGLSVLGDSESDNKTVNLVKALYAYNQAANDYFENE